jgi:hypothetical protein
MRDCIFPSEDLGPQLLVLFIRLAAIWAALAGMTAVLGVASG